MTLRYGGGVLSLLVAFVGFFGSGCANQPDQSEALLTIQSAYDAQSRAYDTKDLRGIVAVCSPDYEDVNVKTNRDDHLAEYAESVKTFLGSAASVDAHATIRAGRIEAGKALVQVDWHTESVTADASSGDHPHHLVVDEIRSDVWIPDRAKGWLKQHSTATSTVAVLDGQPVAP